MQNPTRLLRNVLAGLIALLLVGGVVAYLAEEAGRRAGERQVSDGREEAIPTTTVLPFTTTVPPAAPPTTGAAPQETTTSTTGRPPATTTTVPASSPTTSRAPGPADRPGGRREMPHTGGPSLLVPGLGALATGVGLGRLRSRARQR